MCVQCTTCTDLKAAHARVIDLQAGRKNRPPWEDYTHIEVSDMEIGNAYRQHGHKQRRVQLITPHGDWERSSPAPSTAAQCSSLPLMGIGNVLTHDYTEGVKQLITPHGNWERRGHGALPAEDVAHYPSWGLGTYAAVTLYRGVPLLITPHGDWELPAGPWWLAGSRLAHYPSWGLGTFEVFQAERPVPRGCPRRSGKSVATPARLWYQSGVCSTRRRSHR